MPMAPAPITASDAGGAVGPQMASLFVQKGPSSSPSIGGTVASVPVVSTTRSASTCVPSASSIRCGPISRASWRNTRIPARSNGTAPSPDCISMTSRARCWTAGRSTDHRRDPHAEPAGVAREGAIFALRSITLVGTQP